MLRFDEKQLSRLVSESKGTEDDACSSMFSSDADKDLEAVFVGEEGEDTNGELVDRSGSGSGTESGVRNRHDWRRVRQIYDRSKQYIFVAATLPLNGKGTAGGILKRMFPDANWVSGNYLHHQNPRFYDVLSFITFNNVLDRPCCLVIFISFWAPVRASGWSRGGLKSHRIHK